MTLLAAVVTKHGGLGFTLLAVSFFLPILQSATAIQLLIVLNLVISLWVGRNLWRNVPREAILVFVPLLAFRRRSAPEQGASLPISLPAR